MFADGLTSAKTGSSLSSPFPLPLPPSSPYSPPATCLHAVPLAPLHHCHMPTCHSTCACHATPCHHAHCLPAWADMAATNTCTPCHPNPSLLSHVLVPTLLPIVCLVPSFPVVFIASCPSLPSAFPSLPFFLPQLSLLPDRKDGVGSGDVLDDDGRHE